MVQKTYNVVVATPPSSNFGRVLHDNFSTGARAAWWSADDYRNMGTVVATSHDGGPGPVTGGFMWKGNQNGTVAYNVPETFDTMVVRNIPHNNEYFGRIRFRVCPDFLRDSGSGGKLFRIFASGAVYHDLYCTVRPSTGLSNEGLISNSQLATYWGGTAGDTTNDANSWNIYEWYVNYSTGVLKVWHDNVLIRNETGKNFQGVKFQPFYTQSNFSAPHDAVNTVYIDEVEFFSDTGTGATGSMSDGTASV